VCQKADGPSSTTVLKKKNPGKKEKTALWVLAGSIGRRVEKEGGQKLVGQRRYAKERFFLKRKKPGEGKRWGEKKKGGDSEFCSA